MLVGVVRRAVRKELQSQRLFVTSNALFCKHNVTDKTQDIVVRSPRVALTYPKGTVDQFVYEDLSKWGRKIAVVDGITDRSLTYDKLRDLSRALAVRLQTSLGLKPGDTVAVCLHNSIEYPIVCLGASEAGVIVTTINPMYTSDEIARQLTDCNPKVLFGYARMSNLLQQAVSLSKQPIRIVYVKETPNESLPADGIKLDELTNPKDVDLSALKSGDRDPTEVAFLPYSSGTTGLPKGVRISHKNIIASSVMLNKICELKPAVGDHQEILLNVLPFFHIYGLSCTLLSKLALGYKLVLLPKFTPDTYLNALVKYKTTFLHLVPPIVIFLNSHDKVDAEHMKSVTRVISGAAPLGASDVEKFSSKAPNSSFQQGYGLTETASITHLSTLSSKNYASVGYLTSDTEGKIVPIDDPKGRGVGPNVKGELWVRGPQIMKEYHNNEKATKETITDDGWMKTGDIGHYDENHEFYITDRLKELIKVKAFQVPPAELEEVLRNHPDITDAAVIGISHPTSGEVPRAYVVTKNASLTEKEVKDFVAKKVAEYKRLEGGVEFIDAIPKTATGKILRRSLKIRFESN